MTPSAPGTTSPKFQVQDPVQERLELRRPLPPHRLVVSTSRRGCGPRPRSREALIYRRCATSGSQPPTLASATPSNGGPTSSSRPLPTSSAHRAHRPLPRDGRRCDHGAAHRPRVECGHRRRARRRRLERQALVASRHATRSCGRKAKRYDEPGIDRRQPRWSCSPTRHGQPCCPIPANPEPGSDTIATSTSHGLSLDTRGHRTDGTNRLRRLDDARPRRPPYRRSGRDGQPDRSRGCRRGRGTGHQGVRRAEAPFVAMADDLRTRLVLEAIRLSSAVEALTPRAPRTTVPLRGATSSRTSALAIHGRSEADPWLGLGRRRRRNEAGAGAPRAARAHRGHHNMLNTMLDTSPEAVSSTPSLVQQLLTDLGHLRPSRAPGRGARCPPRAGTPRARRA